MDLFIYTKRLSLSVDVSIPPVIIQYYTTRISLHIFIWCI